VTTTKPVVEPLPMAKDVAEGTLPEESVVNVVGPLQVKLLGALPAPESKQESY
jgi:hypothetical protein